MRISLARSAILRTGLGLLWLFTIYQSSAIVLYEVREHGKGGADLVPGRQVSVWDSRHLVLTSWSDDPVDFRWSVGHHASLMFWQHASFLADDSCSFDFRVVQESVVQSVHVRLNGSPLPNFEARAAGSYFVSFPCRMLRTGKNTVDLEFPNAISPRSVNPASPDNRLLGIGLRTFSVQLNNNQRRSW